MCVGTNTTRQDILRHTGARYFVSECLRQGKMMCGSRTSSGSLVPWNRGREMDPFVGTVDSGEE